MGRSSVVEEEIIRQTRSPPRRPRSRPVVASSVSESEHVMEEVRSTHQSHHSHHSPPPRRSSSRRETIVVEETVRRPPPPQPAQDEFIEVIEEHDVPAPRRSRKSSGFKHIDPEAYGGGDGRFKRVPSHHR